MAAKRTWELIPFCHLLPLERCGVTIKEDTSTANALRIDCQVAANYHTGVEMEALVGATHAALCIYDMCKALSHNIVIQETRLLSKTGGKTDIQMKM